MTNKHRFLTPVVVIVLSATYLSYKAFLRPAATPTVSVDQFKNPVLGSETKIIELTQSLAAEKKLHDELVIKEKLSRPKVLVQHELKREVASVQISEKKPGPKTVQNLLQDVNAELAQPIATLKETSATQERYEFDGESMLLTDGHRLRVSREQFVRFKPLIAHLSSHRLESVIIQASVGVPDAHVQKLISFFRNQYGWNPVIQEAAPSQIFPLQVEVTAVK